MSGIIVGFSSGEALKLQSLALIVTVVTDVPTLLLIVTMFQVVTIVTNGVA